MKLKIAQTTTALLLAATTVNAATSVSQDENELVGSDTLLVVVQDVIADLGLTITYHDAGSSSGERAMEGRATGSDHTCTLAAGSANPGCQEISPMSRALRSNICDDEEAAFAEGLAICDDGLVVLTDNAGYQQTSTGACTTETTSPGFDSLNGGAIRTTGTLSTGYSISDWSDVIRQVYTGCSNDEGDCAAVSRATRCANADRAALIANWSELYDGSDCGTGACDGLRHAYRRDDSSGTTGVFLSLIGVEDNGFPVRSAVTDFLSNVISAPNNTPFCDGGDLEGFFPTSSGSTAGDPISTTCAAEDDLCNKDGTVGVVRAIRSVPSGLPTDGYPELQCTRNAFALIPFFNTSASVCPDGTAPISGNCWAPYYDDAGARNFNCLNTANSRPPGATSSFDGRVYNAFVRDDAGTLETVAARLPQIAQWRQNAAVLKTGFLDAAGGAIAAANEVCQSGNATLNIGCLVANTSCTWGFAGREAVAAAPYDAENEPLLVDGFKPTNAQIAPYPLSRPLFVNAIGGFEYIEYDGIQAGRTPAFVAAELALAQEFYNMGDIATNACENAGFIPRAASDCVGPAASAGCGQAAVLPKSACDPSTQLTRAAPLP